MWIITASVLGAIGVVTGAFGAHALKDRLDPAQLAAWNTAVEYHLLHAVALLAVALYANTTGRAITLPASAFTGGILLFSGSIYLLALGGPRWLGPITPLGGLLLIVAWLSLAMLASEASRG